MNRKIIRSPFFFVGDKYKLMSQLRELFPSNISTYIEPFAGGGSSFLNTHANRYLVNDVDSYVIKLHLLLASYANRETEFIERLYDLQDKYGLSCSYRGITVPDELKKQYVKTYYSYFNKEAYKKMRDDYNNKNDDILLYLLLIYGFNHMIRFNASGKFNLPVGNIDFNNNVHTSIINYLRFIRENNVSFYNMDFKDFLNEVSYDDNTYIYLDPPYLISGSEYNKYWNEEEEKRLCDYLDELDERGIKFGITNLINHKGRQNETFIGWSSKYKVYNIKSNYISYNDNTIKEDSKEVFVTNYGSK